MSCWKWRVWPAIAVCTVGRATFMERRLRAMSSEELDGYIRRGKWM
ncbi:MAG: hypothetical protein ILO34_07665 [Kiritimatiellae bacterium]|nr:hypothetical protein [Kiritimatiellia bacterium]